MKTPKIKPLWMSGIGLVIAPLMCASNVTLTAILTHDVEFRLPSVFLTALILGVPLCFPMGLLSEHVVQLWNFGKVKKSRWLSALYGGGALIFFLFLASEYGAYHAAGLALLSVPWLWSLLLILFAIFTRPHSN